MAFKGPLGIQGFLDSKRYEKVRPSSYHKEAVKNLMTQLGVLKKNGEAYPDKTFNILELGAGTGKFTRVMVDVLEHANVRIIASDPGKNMCDQFKEALLDVEIKQFPAEKIDLKDESMDVVVSANAFHWFADKEESLSEISRVLVPRGMLGLIWSYPDGQTQPWIHEFWKYFDLFYMKRNVFGFLPLHLEEVLEMIPRSEKFGKVERSSFMIPIDYSSTSFFQYVSSLSLFQSSNPQQKAEYEKFYREMIKKYFGEDGKEPSSVDFVVPVCWCQKV